MKLVIALLGLVCFAYAQDFANLLAGMNMPPIPPGMKLDDLRESFRNLPPAMKEQLDSMARYAYEKLQGMLPVNAIMIQEKFSIAYGMSIDDVEQALDNPPEQLKQLFESKTEL